MQFFNTKQQVTIIVLALLYVISHNTQTLTTLLPFNALLTHCHPFTRFFFFFFLKKDVY